MMTSTQSLTGNRQPSSVEIELGLINSSVSTRSLSWWIFTNHSNPIFLIPLPLYLVPFGFGILGTATITSFSVYLATTAQREAFIVKLRSWLVQSLLGIDGTDICQLLPLGCQSKTVSSCWNPTIILSCLHLAKVSCPSNAHGNRYNSNHSLDTNKSVS